jgi:membrane-associated phospholipid phosphatase
MLASQDSRSQALARQQRFVLILLAVALIFAAAGLLGLDRPIAEFIHNAGWEHAWFFSRGTDALDFVGILAAPKYVFGGVVCLLGLAITLRASWRAHGVAVVFAGAMQCLCVFVSGVVKGEFSRMRPFQLLESGDWAHGWFSNGSSFPSGHNAWYWGLFLPLAFAYPRWRWPLIAIPVFIAIAREIDAMHFVSDVTVAIAMVCLFTLAIGTAIARYLPLSSTNR